MLIYKSSVSEHGSLVSFDCGDRLDHTVQKSG